MASVLGNYEERVMERELTKLYLKATLSSGAATIVTTGGASRGITSIAKTATGVYLVTLDEKWAELRFVAYIMVGATQLALNLNVETDSALSAGTFVLTFQNDAEADTDLADGTLLMEIVLRNTSEM